MKRIAGVVVATAVIGAAAAGPGARQVPEADLLRADGPAAARHLGRFARPEQDQRDGDPAAARTRGWAGRRPRGGAPPPRRRSTRSAA